MTIKALTDLQGLKQGNLAELAGIGINTVEELKAALNDSAKVKEIIKNLSGVGPKTVEHWKEAFKADSEAKPKKAEPKEEAKAETKTKEAKPKKEEKAEAKAEAKTKKAEPKEEVKVVEVVEETGGYKVKAKPEISDETADALAKRAIISGRRPAFKRQEWFRYSKLGEKWRRPKGIHSKMKRNLKRRPPVVDIGFRGPASARYLHPSGFEEVLVFNVDGLIDIDPKVQAVRIGGTVGTKKRIAIEDRADELGIRVLNRMV